MGETVACFLCSEPFPVNVLDLDTYSTYYHFNTRGRIILPCNQSCKPVCLVCFQKHIDSHSDTAVSIRCPGCCVPMSRQCIRAWKPKWEKTWPRCTRPGCGCIMSAETFTDQRTNMLFWTVYERYSLLMCASATCAQIECGVCRQPLRRFDDYKSHKCPPELHGVQELVKRGAIQPCDLCRMLLQCNKGCSRITCANCLHVQPWRGA